MCRRIAVLFLASLSACTAGTGDLNPSDTDGSLTDADFDADAGSSEIDKGALSNVRAAPFLVGAAFSFAQDQRQIVAISSIDGSVWRLDVDLATWVQLVFSGERPSPKTGSCAALDSSSQFLVSLGGASNGVATGEVWFLALSDLTWRRGPDIPSRTEHACAFDTMQNRVLVYGGRFEEDLTGQIGALSLDDESWSEIAPSSGEGPTAQISPFMFLDADEDRLLIAGGREERGPRVEPKVWAFGLQSGEWQPIANRPSFELEDGALSFDRSGRRLVAYNLRASLVNTLRVDMVNASWEGVGLPGFYPFPRSKPLAIWDDVFSRFCIFGGVELGAFELSWCLSLEPSLEWNALGEPHSRPEINYPTSSTESPLGPLLGGKRAAFVSERGELVVATGEYTSTTGSELLAGWSGDFRSARLNWAKTRTSTRPTARSGHSMSATEATKGALFGGIDAEGVVQSDLWMAQVSGSTVTWERVAEDVGLERWGHASVIDRRGRLLVFGGFEVLRLASGVWAVDVDLGSAEELITGGQPPELSAGLAIAYDKVRDRVFGYGGLTVNGDSSVLWSLDLGSNPPRWSTEIQSSEPGPASTHSLLYHLESDSLILFLPTYRSMSMAVSGVDELTAELGRYSLMMKRWSRVEVLGENLPQRTNGQVFEMMDDHRAFLVTQGSAQILDL